MPRRHSIPNRSSQKRTRSEILRVLAFVPLAVGVLLILSALTGLIVWGTLAQQIAMGGLYIFLSFAALNAMQKQWQLVLGWGLLGAAIWLGESVADSFVLVLIGILVSLAVGLLAREFLLRRRQYLGSQTH